MSDVDSRVDGRGVAGTFVSGNAFQVLAVHAAMGRALTPADDQPFAGRPVMVLSHRGWDRLFTRDPGVVGRELLINEVSFEIVGVMPEGFRGLAADAPDDYWAPLSMLDHVRPVQHGSEATAGLSIIGRLKPGVPREAAVAQLAGWDARQSDASTGSGASRPFDTGATSRDERGGSRLTLVAKRGTVQ